MAVFVPNLQVKLSIKIATENIDQWEVIVVLKSQENIENLVVKYFDHHNLTYIGIRI